MYAHDLDLFATVQFHEDTPALLSLQRYPLGLPLPTPSSSLLTCSPKLEFFNLSATSSKKCQWEFAATPKNMSVRICLLPPLSHFEKMSVRCSSLRKKKSQSYLNFQSVKNVLVGQSPGPRVQTDKKREGRRAHPHPKKCVNVDLPKCQVHFFTARNVSPTFFRWRRREGQILTDIFWGGGRGGGLNHSPANTE